MNSLLVLAILLAVLPAVVGYSCLSTPCEQQNCREVTVENCQGTIARNASMCGGCCDVCLTVLEPGATCYGRDYYFNYIYTVCSDGYYCDEGNTDKCQAFQLFDIEEEDIGI